MLDMVDRDNYHIYTYQLESRRSQPHVILLLYATGGLSDSNFKNEFRGIHENCVPTGSMFMHYA